MPITVLSGDRSPWLMLAMNFATNLDLRLLASWFSMRAKRSANRALSRNVDFASRSEFAANSEFRLAESAAPPNMTNRRLHSRR